MIHERDALEYQVSMRQVSETYEHTYKGGCLAFPQLLGTRTWRGVTRIEADEEGRWKRMSQRR